MYQGQTVFSQLMDFLPRHAFRQCVNRYQGNYRIRSFSCYDQLLCMAFAQLTFRESLRDIECCLRALEEKLYHADQGLLWDFGKRREDPNLDRRVGLCAGGDRSKAHADR